MNHNERWAIFICMIIILVPNIVVQIYYLLCYTVRAIFKPVIFVCKTRPLNNKATSRESTSPNNFLSSKLIHDDVIKWKHFPRYWPFVWGIHRSPVNSPHKGQWRGALMFSLICVWINGSVNNREAGDLKRYRAHYDVTVIHIFNCPLHTRSISHHTIRNNDKD